MPLRKKQPAVIWTGESRESMYRRGPLLGTAYVRHHLMSVQTSSRCCGWRRPITYEKSTGREKGSGRANVDSTGSSDSVSPKKNHRNRRTSQGKMNREQERTGKRQGKGGLSWCRQAVRKRKRDKQPKLQENTPNRENQTDIAGGGFEKGRASENNKLVGWGRPCELRRAGKRANAWGCGHTPRRAVWRATA